MMQDPDFLIELAHTRMPFGKFKGRDLIDLPEHYIVWYHAKGFPKGKIGQMLGLVYELKLNGLEYLVKEIKHKHQRPNTP
ncbi:DUF3820 family protein [Flavobacteriaceae bacterium F08102]|nr:DUF3820 family protein [Flavobacteriaceae bacterium F08102]